MAITKDLHICTNIYGECFSQTLPIVHYSYACDAFGYAQNYASIISWSLTDNFNRNVIIINEA